jgi:manganese/zinc/iron transport system permease protein
VVGLQTVGVVLMSAMVVAPAAAARQWTDRLGLMVVLAALIGALAGVIGAVVSSAAARMPTGPTIVVAVSALVVVSLLLAPNRGLVWGWARERRARRRLRLDAVLADLQALATQHGGLEHGHAAAVVSVMEGGRDVEGALGELEARGWARRVAADEWALTPAGNREADRRFGRAENVDDDAAA